MNQLLYIYILHLQVYLLSTLFVFVDFQIYLQVHLQVHLQHKKSGVHNRSNQLEPRHYRISRLNTT